MGETRSQGLGGGRKKKGKGGGSYIYNREKREETEKRAWMWAAERTDRGSQPPTERTEAMGGEAQDDHFRGSK